MPEELRLQAGWYCGWYYDGDYIKSSELRAAIALLRSAGFSKFQITEITTKTISIDHLDILSDP
jgi:hypothetical protein